MFIFSFFFVHYYSYSYICTYVLPSFFIVVHGYSLLETSLPLSLILSLYIYIYIHESLDADAEVSSSLVPWSGVIATPIQSSFHA